MPRPILSPLRRETASRIGQTITVHGRPAVVRWLCHTCTDRVLLRVEMNGRMYRVEPDRLVPVKDVRCPVCGTEQADMGKQQTCERCGSSPLPSYDYEQDSAFHPSNRQPSVFELARRQLGDR